MSRIVYRSEGGLRARAFLAPAEEIVRAAQEDVAAAGELAKTDARANYLSAGLGGKFAQGSCASMFFYKKTGTSLMAAAQIFHKIPYCRVFEKGATIRGRPRMWVPLPSTPKRSGRYRMTRSGIRKEVGPLQFFVKRQGRQRCWWQDSRHQDGQARQGDAVRTPGCGHGAVCGRPRCPSLSASTASRSASALNITKAVRRARDRLPELYAQNFRGT